MKAILATLFFLVCSSACGQTFWTIPRYYVAPARSPYGFFLLNWYSPPPSFIFYQPRYYVAPRSQASIETQARRRIEAVEKRKKERERDCIAKGIEAPFMKRDRIAKELNNGYCSP